MFEKSLQDIFTKDKLIFELQNYKKAKDFQETKEQIERDILKKLLNQEFTPEPLKAISIKKDEFERRNIAISNTLNRVIQRVLIKELEESIKFSDKSYAYRRNKGTLKAINRVKDFLKRFDFVARVDIEKFFDNIEQSILIEKLEKSIKDREVIELILLFVKNGALKGVEWIDKELGINQGDNISPFLSNLYLDEFDKYLESENISFVRFADDIIIFGKNHKEAKSNSQKSEQFLEKLKLNFNPKKRYISSIKNGFEYLGLYFHHKKIVIDSQRFDKKILKIKEKLNHLLLDEAILKVNEHIIGIKRYYSRVVTLDFQIEILQKNLDEIFIEKIKYEKENRITTSKKLFFQKLNRLESYENIEKDRYINSLIERAYQSLERPIDKVESKIEKSKNSYHREIIKSTEIILSKPALSIGVSRGKVTVKERGQILKTMPKNRVTRVIVLSKGVSLSSNFIEFCAKNRIDIDFISHKEPYAMITYFKTISNKLYLKQLELKNSKKALEFAKEFVKSKAKNQINLIKYFAKRRENEGFEELIERMEELWKSLKSADTNERLMGYEGNISKIYWQCFGKVIDKEEFRRVTKGAIDPINSALNYGYAILYNRIQTELLKSHLNIYISFLHQEQSNKPTLVYDLIEEFRQMVVDREIISIITKGFEFRVNRENLLNSKAKEIIIKNIQERLSSYSTWRRGKYRFLSIIEHQSNLLARAIEQKAKYKGFVGRI